MISDSLWKILGILLAGILLYVTPLISAYEREDALIASYVDTETREFSEKIQEIGYLDKNMYMDFTSKLAATGNVYDIELEHLSKNYEKESFLKQTDYTEDLYYNGTYEEDILDEINIGNKYKMKVGDFFFVTVKNKNLTKSQTIGKILGIGFKGRGIFYKRGGTVRYGDT